MLNGSAGFSTNEQDLLNAVTAAEVIEKLGLHNFEKVGMGHIIRLCRAHNLCRIGELRYLCER